MKGRGKDSPEVVRFMSLFARLKDWCDDEPDDLTDLAASDAGVKKLCLELLFVGHRITSSERSRAQVYSSPVDPSFMTHWRDYEDRYHEILSDIWIGDLFPELESADLPTIPRADVEWTNADQDGEEQAEYLEGALRFAAFNADEQCSDLPEEFVEGIEEGIGAWSRLKVGSGLDVRGTLRRRDLIPFVLVPRQVAAKYGSSEKLSMLRNLEHAHRAFVFGASYAALALMRSILETVLRDHYGASGKNLYVRIDNTAGRLPSGASAAALHRLRKLANAILHFDQDRDEGIPKLDEPALEREIVSLLLVLRALIEGAK